MFKINLSDPESETVLQNIAHLVRGLERDNLIFTLVQASWGTNCQFRIWSTGRHSAKEVDPRGFGGDVWAYNNNPWLLAVITGINRESVETACKIFWDGKTQSSIQGTRRSWCWR